MKIRLITFHTPKNYGAVLQAYSLMSALERRCGDVKIIDFNTAALRSRYPIIPKFSGIKGFAAAVLNGYTYLPKYYKYKKFNEFVDKKLKLTERYDNVDKLYAEKWDDDTVFVSGSDQVFNPNRIEEERKAFYMDFVPDENYKFSYAASFGVSEIPDDKKDEIKRYLWKIDAVSVREASGIGIVKSVSDKNAAEVVDPTLLNDKSFWEKCEKPYKKSFTKYLLYYRLLGSKESDRTAMQKAKENGLRLVVVTEKSAVGLKGAKILRNVGPDELLWLYDKADYVVSDSFHGVAFAAVYQKPFNFSDYNPALNMRGLNLIAQLGISPEVVSKFGDGRIDYSSVEKKLNELRKAAFDFIDNSLKQAGEGKL